MWENSSSLLMWKKKYIYIHIMVYIHHGSVSSRKLMLVLIIKKIVDWMFFSISLQHIACILIGCYIHVLLYYNNENLREMYLIWKCLKILKVLKCIFPPVVKYNVNKYCHKKKKMRKGCLFVCLLFIYLSMMPLG